MSRRHFLARLSVPGLALAAAPGLAPAAETVPGPGDLNVKSFGARGDGATLDTSALQKAIEACAQSGGGTVRLPPGRYLSGTLFLKSHVTLHLEAGATLLGSTKLEDYPNTISKIRSYTDNYTERSLIYGEGLEQISLRGRGVIDGQGGSFKGPYKVRPYMIRIIDCRDVSVQGVTLKDSPMWVQHYLACDGVQIDGITLLSKCNANNDGIDIDGCQSVRISNCEIQSGDDAIVLKSTLNRPCRNVAVTNCILSSDCNAFKLGTESNGGFENIVLSNCAIHDTRLAGIALEEVDGGILNRVNISNITMDKVKCPIFMRLGNRARPFDEKMEKPGIGGLRNVSISHVQATGADRTGCSITGLPGHPVENVTLTDVRISSAGGGTSKDAERQPPEKPEAYPEYYMFGVLPAYGFYCRHVRNLVLENIQANATDPDERPALVCEDADNLSICGWSAETGSARAPVMRFENVRNAIVRGCRGPRKGGTFLRVGGKDGAGIELQANALAGFAHPVEIGPEVQRGAVTVNGLAAERGKSIP